MQHEKPCLWVFVDPFMGREPRTFWVVGTGHPLPLELASMTYIGTVQLMSGALVFHVFEECHVA
jgi:hypothetical protein